MATKDWNAAQYLKFEAERTRPSRDLLAQIPLKSPKRILDLGCGPGNSTQVLAQHFPNAKVSGVDSSPDMIKKAQSTYPNIDFELGDLNTYKPKEPVDVMFSNAVLHWVPYKSRVAVIKRLLETLPSGGVFAFQVPDNWREQSHECMRQVASEGSWAGKMDGGEPHKAPFQSAQELYDAFKPVCSEVDIWYTTYHHVLDDHQAIVEWFKGSGLRPFIDPLSEDDSAAFQAAYLDRLKQGYPLQYDGKVLLRFPRLFVVAVRS